MQKGADVAEKKLKPLKLMGHGGYEALAKKVKESKEPIEVYSNPHNCMALVVGTREEPNGATVFHLRLPDGEYVNSVTTDNLAWEMPEQIAAEEEVNLGHIVLDPLNRAGISLDEILEIHKELAQEKKIIRGVNQVGG